MIAHLPACERALLDLVHLDAQSGQMVSLMIVLSIFPGWRLQYVIVKFLECHFVYEGLSHW
jgi:hypothetical protein